MKSDPLIRLVELNHTHTAPTPVRLRIGSDVEIAERVREDLERTFGDIVHDEGAFWRYETNRWAAIPEAELRRATHGYDGAMFFTPEGRPSQVKLSKSRVDSTLNEMAAMMATPEFFANRPTGINCISGFIRFDGDGTPVLEDHDPDHRCRHTLPGSWSPGVDATIPDGSLLAHLLGGIFKGDDDCDAKVGLLAELAGAAALGYATRLRQPRAVILKGETAENGKSQILDVTRALLPPSAICSVTAASVGDERHVIGLVGKLPNASDELSSSSAIASETFKAVVTGEPVQGRDVYKSRVEFRPVAQHLFATNNLPVFQGGMDRGVKRRLLVVAFNRTIPEAERIEAIGRRIGEEEPHLLLAWAVDGASRLIRNKVFSLPASSRRAMNHWLYGADPVLAWLAEEVDPQPILGNEPRVATRDAYERFRGWALAEGFSERTLPSINTFVQRTTANAAGIEYHRTRQGHFFLGMALEKRNPMDFNR